jgi:integrase
MRQLNRLTVRQVATIRKPGRYADGGNLILRVSPEGNKTFALLYMRNGRSRCMGIGPTTAVSLKLARELAAQGREQLARGLDPIDERNRALALRLAEAVRRINFERAAEQFVRDHSPRWRNAQHAQDWESSLRLHVLPVLGKLPVGEIDLPAVLKVLQPLWNTVPKTGMRCRARIEMVLDWCIARGFRDGPNPARWGGFLDKLLPPVGQVAPTKHQLALPWQELPKFMAELRAHDNVAAKALAFTILTCARVSEVVDMEWAEVDLAAGTWTCPAHRMKANREHVVPLPARALELLQALPRDGERPFPCRRGAVLRLLRRTMGLAGQASVHGFRASFKSWAGDTAAAEPEVVERCLAHIIKDKTERAYDRSTMLKRRAVLLELWADFLDGRHDQRVVKLRG